MENKKLLNHESCIKLDFQHDRKIGKFLKIFPVDKFLKICTKEKNIKMEKKVSSGKFSLTKFFFKKFQRNTFSSLRISNNDKQEINKKKSKKKKIILYIKS